MRADISMKRDGPLHSAVKEYAEENSVRMLRAYAALIQRGLEAEGYDIDGEDKQVAIDGPQD